MFVGRESSRAIAIDRVSVMVSLYPLIVLFVLAVATKRIVISLLGGLATASIVAGWDNGLGPLFLLTERMSGILLSKETLLCFVFILSLGIVSHLVTDSGAAAAFSRHILSKNRSNSNRFLEVLLWIMSIPLAIDDYLSTIARGGLARSFSHEANIPRTRLAYQVHSTSFSLHVLMPLSSTVVVVLALLEAEAQGRIIPGYSSPFWFYFQTIPYNAYSVIASCIPLILIFWGGSDDCPHGTRIEREHDERETGSFSPYDILIPLFLLPLSTILLFFFPWFSGGVALTELLSKGEILPCLLPSSVISILVFSLVVIRRGGTGKELLHWSSAGVKTIAPVCLVLMLGWTLGTILSRDLKTGEVVSQFLAVMPGQAALFPALIFLVSAFVTALLGCPWTSLGVLIPIVLHAISSVGGAPSVLWTAAVFSGVNLGEQASPLSDLSILTSRSLGISPFSHSFTQLPLILAGGVSALFAFLLLGIGEGPFFALFTGLLVATVLAKKRRIGESFSS